MSVHQFPPTERGELRMAHASLDSVPVRAQKPRTPQIMWALLWPALCSTRPCYHVMCQAKRDQAALPCARCQKVIEAGQRFSYVNKVEDRKVIEQIHFTCATAEEHFV